MSIIIICGILLFFIAVAFAAMQDIRLLRLQKHLHRYPNARKFRTRPWVSIHFHNQPTHESLTSINKNTYRHKKIVESRDADAEYSLILSEYSILAPDAIKRAVLYMSMYPQSQAVALTPQLLSAQTISHFFQNYTVILSAPFVNILTLFNLQSAHHSSAVPILSRTTIPPHHIRRHTLIAFLSTSVGTFLFISLLTYSVTMGQFIPLLLGFITFYIWGLWAIAQYSQLTFWHKMTTFLLLPAAMPYFIYRLLTTPLRLVSLVFSRRRVLS